MRQLSGLIRRAYVLIMYVNHGSGRMTVMRTFLGSVAAAIVVAVVAMYALEGAWRPADKAFATTGARVTNEGHNLVGKDWYSSRQF